MRDLYKLFSVLFFFCFSISQAQAPMNFELLAKNYKAHFQLDRERVFLHLNKTSIVPNEDLWLSAYVYNPQLNLPSTETVNLELDIYDEQGNWIDSKTLFISQGKGSAFIELDPEVFLPGKYLIRASTNYMKNFEEDLSYNQAFTIVGAPDPKTGRDEMMEVDYDLQLLPEGGHLVAGLVNSVGVKLIDENGFGISFRDGSVIDSKGRIITDFKSNRFGHSRFFLKPQPGENYTVVLTTETGEELSKEIDKPKAEGISMVSIDRKDHFLFTVKTNSRTREQLEDQNFHLAIHQDGDLRDLEFQFPKEALEVNILISKDSLFPGVNTITVFDPQLRPVLERMVFNTSGIKRAELTGNIQSRVGDSLVIGLASDPTVENSSLSVSVLPGETIAYDPNNNILSAFLLRPYIKGNIEDPQYYFAAENKRKRSHDLDLLLLTQGWSKYDWSGYEDALEEIFEREKGFTIEGEISDYNERRENTLFVRSKESQLFEVVEINENNRFCLENVFLIEDAQISFGTISERDNEVSKPTVDFNIFPKEQHPNLGEDFVFPKINKDRKQHTDVLDLPDSFSDDFVALEAVAIEGKAKMEEEGESLIGIIEDEFKITPEIEDRFHYVTDYIATKGFRVFYQFGKVYIQNIKTSTIKTGPPDVMIYLNGIPIGTDASILYKMPTSRVKSIVVNTRGYGSLGMRGVNGVVKIWTKTGGYIPGDQETLQKMIIENGFVGNREFYVPEYTSKTGGVFKKYGAVEWISDLTPGDDGKVDFTIPDFGLPQLNLYVEGMNANGVLISEVISLETGN